MRVKVKVRGGGGGILLESNKKVNVQTIISQMSVCPRVKC